jgi:hypothetical protein
MKKIFIGIAALLVAACASPPPQPCLGVGEAGRVLSIQQWKSGTMDYVDLKITTDNKSVRICRANIRDIDQLVAGDVITGYTNETVSGFSADWYRVR